MSLSHRQIFTRIGITTQKPPQAIPVVNTLIHILQSHYPQCQIFLNEKITGVENNQVVKMALADLCAKVDLVITIGGDGTLINTARFLLPHNTPVVGINLGHLGYLTDIIPNEVETEIQKIMAGEFWVEKRQMLSAYVDSTPENKMLALNEMHITRTYGRGLMTDLEIHVDGNYLIRQRSDGILVNTPTGSTAYALSAGGPIISPQLSAIGITPISPHTLSYRPIILSDHSKITIIPHNKGQKNLCIADGKNTTHFNNNEQIIIQKHHSELHLIHPNSHNEFKVLASKLGWGG